ncbi:hypothetical protein EV424DRAFT_1539073 [Suillus variegatus]|nr:hypothetical protein EV424DRAFT_1539073 [Suillus variegatus]
MHRSTPYNYWEQDSELYPHVKASNAERLQTTTDYGQSTPQPHHHILHSVLENFRGDSTPIVSQHHIAYDGDFITEDSDQTVGPRADALDPGMLPVPIAQGDIQSDAAGWQLRCASPSYSPYAFSDYLPAHNTMGFSDTNFADPRHQLQEENYSHLQYVINDDESELHVDCASECQWNDGYGICGRTIDAAKIGKHMSSYHFKSPLPADSRLKCLWKDCELYKPVRRDTIIRHIVEKHLGLKYRCKLWVASHAGADFCGSRKNARLY